MARSTEAMTEGFQWATRLHMIRSVDLRIWSSALYCLKDKIGELLWQFLDAHVADSHLKLAFLFSKTRRRSTTSTIILLS